MMLPPVPAPLDATNSFVWQIPWDDATPGTADDMSRLNARPAGAGGRVVMKGGRFVESGSGRRVRFLGTNAGTGSALPSKREADIRAARMAKMGINLVRLHHLNNGWETESGGSVWKKGRNWVEIDPAQLDKLDYFVAALKKRGIYVNVNLQVSREYVPELGFPASVRELKNFAKKIDKINPRMIELQKQYARDLIDRKNPYTGLKYKDDPAVAIVEINNENSLVGWPGESPGAGLDGFPEPFRSEIRARWTEWLLSKYKDDAGLRAAWPRIERFDGPGVPSSSKWTYENQGGGEVVYTELESGPADDAAWGLRAEVKSTDGVGWHVQAHFGGLSLESGKEYVVTFRARADRELAVGVDSRLDQPDWRFLGLGSTVLLTPEWKEYSLGFRATETVAGHARIGFVLGEKAGTTEIRSLSVRPGVRAAGVPDGETLAAGNLSFPSQDGSPRSRDWTRFLTETETAYSEEMRDFLRNDLGFRTPMNDTQISWGGMTALARERRSEIADDHAYWQHPTFKGGEWNPKDYFVTRGALVDEWGKSFATLGNLAKNRVAGKAFSVSEYDHPSPSDFNSEMMPLFASFGAFQDWDALYTFAWSNSKEGQPNDSITGYFDVDRNPAIAAYYPAAAVMFREFGIAPASLSRVMSVPAERPYEPEFSYGGAWGASGGVPDLTTTRIAVQAKGETIRAVTGGAPKPSPFAVKPGAGGQIVTGAGTGAAFASGFVADQAVVAGPLSMKFGKFAGGFATAALAATDGKPLATSRRLLLTLAGRVENKGWKWNAERTSVGDDWGRGPVVCERVPATVTLKGAAYRVFALDGRGKRIKEVPTAKMAGATRFATRGADTLWFELAR